MDSIGYGYPFTPPFGFGTGSLALGGDGDEWGDNEDHIVRGIDFTR